jgi:hypothetical protein
MRLNFSEAPITYGIYTESRGFSSLLGRTLKINNAVREVLGKAVKLKIMSGADSFNEQIKPLYTWLDLKF